MSKTPEGEIKGQESLNDLLHSLEINIVDLEGMLDEAKEQGSDSSQIKKVKAYLGGRRTLMEIVQKVQQKPSLSGAERTREKIEGLFDYDGNIVQYIMTEMESFAKTFSQSNFSAEINEKFKVIDEKTIGVQQKIKEELKEKFGVETFVPAADATYFEERKKDYEENGWPLEHTFNLNFVDIDYEPTEDEEKVRKVKIAEILENGLMFKAENGRYFPLVRGSVKVYQLSR